MPRIMPRKRTIIGGVAAIGVIVGIWLSGKLPHMGSGFGLGSGGDSVLGQPDTSNVAVNASDGAKHAEPSDHNDDDLSPSKRSSRPLDPLDDVLTILVEDRHYAVWKKTRKSNGYYPTELDAVVQLALDAQPNDDGIRVRIIRSKSARVTAWQSLQAELVKAGVPAESVMLAKELLE